VRIQKETVEVDLPDSDYGDVYSNSDIPEIGNDTSIIKLKNRPLDEEDILRGRSPEVLFFLGAGASVPAGLSAILKLVDDFKKWLEKEGKTDYLELTERIVQIIATSPKSKNNGKVDIEKLLEMTERLENSHEDFLLDFYENCNPLLQKTKGYHLVSQGNRLLSNEIKAFIKTAFTEKKLDMGYLKTLNYFINSYRPLHIFSTNYDICIETFCEENDKKYFDGFTPSWDADEFMKRDVDVLLYKLHGSVRWYRTEQGDYEASRLTFAGASIYLDTHREAVPLILYPGRKFQYIEPMFDILAELKKQLNQARYVFVIGYSFRDEHLARMFRYSAKRNPNLRVFLIGPDAHRIYFEVLKRHIDNEFLHSFSHESYTDRYNIDMTSKLEGRVICLPYKIEKVMGSLQYVYLKNLIGAENCEKMKEFEEISEYRGLVRWDECLRQYAECEYTERIEKIIDEKMDLNTLMKINYQLGGEIIIKSFLNNLLWDPGRQKWLNKFREYLPITPVKIEIKITAGKDLYLQTKQRLDQTFFGREAFAFYKSLLDIYDGHLIFSNRKASKTPDNNGLKIRQILEYLEGWTENIALTEWPNKRRDNYKEEVQFLEIEISENMNTPSDNLPDNIMSTINKIEAKELQARMETST
jgi:SIR2-like domain